MTWFDSRKCRYGSTSHRSSSSSRKQNCRPLSKLIGETLEPRMLLTTAPIGDQFVVAETLGFTATPAAIAVHANGSFTTAFESFEEDGSGFGVFAQRFNPDGTAASAKYLVNSTTAREQSAPATAVDPLGNELVVWQSKGQDGDGFGIYGQWYNTLGAKIGSEFKINTITVGDQKAPAVAIDGDGNAIVAWQSFGQDGSDWGVYSTRLGPVVADVPDTTPTGDELVNDAMIGIQQNPSVAAADNGNFVITWEAIDPLGGDDASLDVYAKAFNSTGTQITHGEQLINSDQLRDQVTPQAAIDADGDFVIVWTAGGIPGSGSDVFGQRFNELGERQGQQFRVNNTTLASQVGGVVSMDADGNFLVAWQSVHQDGFSEGIFGREYAADGTTLVDEFQVNTVTEGPQSVPSLGMNAAGRAVVTWHGKNEEHQSALFAQRFDVPNVDPNFRVGTELELASFVELEGNGASAAMDVLGNSVVVFESYDEDGDAMGVFGQLLDNFGDPIGIPFQVNTAFLGTQGAPAVAHAPAANGNFVVVWHSNQDGNYDIFAQRYTSAGAKIGGEFKVNSTNTAGSQVTPVVAMGDDGRFVVVWQGVDGDGTGIFAQRYDGTGAPVGGEFQVNHFEDLDQIMPAVTMNAAGQFAIAWVSSHPASTEEGEELDSEKSIFVQWYDENGISDGPEVIAHVFVEEAQESPQIGMDAEGHFVVAWQSINQDGSTWGVYGRQFDNLKNPLSLEEFRINEETEGLQRLVGLGVDADGNFVVAFESTVPGTDDGISTDIYRREFFPDGTPNGSENLVNTWTGGPQTLPVVARAATGNYGIFWMGQGFSHIDGVHGRLYDVTLVDDPGQPSRVPIGDQFLVGTTVGFEFGSPAVAVHDDGSFTIAFETFEEDTSGFGIFTERFDEEGVAIAGSRVQVNTTVQDDQSAPAIATDPSGNVLYVWQGKEADGSFGIFGRWYQNQNSAFGAEFKLNTTAAGDQTNPDVAIDENGRAIVAWQSLGQDGNGLGVYYTVLDTIGDTIASGDVQANVTTAGDQQAPRVAASAFDDNDANNQFVIAWQGPGPADEGEEGSVDVFARRLNATGALVGGEFIVNSIPERDQILPDLGMDAAGNVVFVWQAEGQQGSGSDVFGRRMEADGDLLGVDVRINTTTSRPQRLPSVAMDADGNYLVAWQSQHQDGFSWGIYRQGFNADGTKAGGEVIVNHRVEGPQTAPTVASNTSGDAVVAWLGNSATHQPSIFAHLFDLPATEVAGEILLTSYVGLEETAPAAAMNSDRESVVVWESYAEDGSGMGVFAQLLDAQGAPIGSRFPVNENITLGNQGAPAVARAPGGEFVIAWQSEVAGGTYDIFARRYDVNGEPDGDIFQVNPTTIPGDQKAPTVAMDEDRRFVIAWETDSADGSLDIMAQFYSANGLEHGSEFVVNQETALDQYDPAAAMNAAGQLVMAWVSDHPAAVPGTEDTEKSIFVRAYGSNWQPVGDEEVLVHKYVKDAQEAPVVGIDSEGRFVVAWQSINQDGNSWGVFARRFEADMTPIDRREFVVNETRLGPQRFAGVGVDEYGRFVIAWQSNTRAELADGGSGGGGGGGEPGTPEGSSWDLFARQYSWDGTPEGGELPVNTWQMGPQILPVVAQAPGGDFGIFWLGQGPDHVEGVHGRLYQSLFEFGDAPDPTYPTLLASDGARHLPFSTIYLGAGMDAEFDGQPSVGATGDDNDAKGDDEDGVVAPELMIPKTDATFVVTASADAILNAWIDWNMDGDFDSFERIADSIAVVAGANEIVVGVPSNARVGTTYARFRISSTGGLSPDGAALDGEVEDYQVQVGGKNMAILVPDPENPGEQMLLVLGTTANNTLNINPRSGGQVRVQNGRQVLGNFRTSDFDRIVIHGLAGNDTIRVNTRVNKPVEIHGNEGNDSLYGGNAADMLFGDEGNDSLYGNKGHDELFGGEGNDKLYGHDGDDHLWAGDGNDAAYGGNGNDKVYGEDGNDRVYGDAGSDLVLGGHGNDTVYGGRGRDLLIGGKGTDRIYGQQDDDLLIGGSTSYDEDEQALLEILHEWRSSAGFLTRIANLSTLLDENTIIGEGVRDDIYGSSGRDWMLDFELEDGFRDFSSNSRTGDQKN